MHNVVRLPINPRPRTVEDPAAAPPPAAARTDEPLGAGAATALVLLLLALPWLALIDLMLPRKR